MLHIMRSRNSGDLTNISISREDIPSPVQLKTLCAANRMALLKTVQKLAKYNPRELDRIIHSLHGQAFSLYDCLDCANCCRTISPAMSHNDVGDLAKKLKIKPSEVMVKHLRMDEEGDFVFREAPCPLIDDDNYCSVYSHRPKACREYPHTDRARFYQLLKLSLKNAEVCPVVYSILMKLK